MQCVDESCWTKPSQHLAGYIRGLFCHGEISTVMRSFYLLTIVANIELILR